MKVVGGGVFEGVVQGIDWIVREGVSLCVSWAVLQGFKMGFEMVGRIWSLTAASGRSF